MLSELAHDEVEPRKTRKGETLPRKVGLPDVPEDIYEENNIDGTFQTMSRSRTILYKVGSLRFVPHRKNTIIHTSVCYIFFLDTNDDTWVVCIMRFFLCIIAIPSTV